MNLLPSGVKFFSQKSPEERGDDTFDDVTHLIVNDDSLDRKDEADEITCMDDEDDSDDDNGECDKCRKREEGETNITNAKTGSPNFVVNGDIRDCGKAKKTKPLRKRVRKRVWRAVRTSWKYLRRGMAGYASGIALASVFMWGVNFNTSFRGSAKRP